MSFSAFWHGFCSRLPARLDKALDAGDNPQNRHEEVTVKAQIEALQAEIARCEEEIADLTAQPGGSSLHYWSISELLERIKLAQTRIEWLRYHAELRASTEAAAS
jgi:uncharacterized small protein (DUF1192 family)